MRSLFRHLFRKPSDENVERFYAVVEKYGYGEVPAREVYAFFEELASSGLDGFTTIKPGMFVRQADADVMHVLGLQARKGWAYTVCWGASLPYLPQLSGGRLRWHRTAKSARFDLWEDPFEYFTAPGDYVAQNGHGTQYLRETMAKMWSAVRDSIQSWFRAAGDLSGILSRAEEQQRREWKGPRHVPEPQLVSAFTLRRLGRTAEARLAFDGYVACPGVSTTDADLLRAALDK
ncbi:MAG TPA: hypothetical protein VMU04_12485 [Candidatus Acidoferrum sp.]|nr:hypothetical protein [Candidatus Acidoferrum sp.]